MLTGKFNKKMKIGVYSIYFLTFIIFFQLVAASAGPLDTSGSAITEGKQQTEKFLTASGINSSSSVADIMRLVIQTFLSLLSIIFIVLILYAGFNWMTAAGDEKKVEDAKGTITKAVIGLVIIIAAFAITYFVFNALPYGIQGQPTINP
jgi:hypothetical protein